MDFVDLTAKNLIEQGKLDDAKLLLKKYLVVADKHSLASRSLLIKIIDIYNKSAQYRKALKYSIKLVESLSNTDERMRKAQVYRDIGLIYTNISQYDNAVEYLEKSLSVFVELENRMGEVQCYVILGYLHFHLGQATVGIAYIQKGFQLRQELEHRLEVNNECISLATTCFRSGQYKKAYEYFQTAVTIWLEGGYRLREGCCYKELGQVCLRFGQYKKAVEYFNKCLTIYMEVGDTSFEEESYRYLAVAYRCLAQYDKTIKYSQKGLALCLTSGDGIGVGHHYDSLGNAYTSLGQFGKAIWYYEKGLDILFRKGGRLAQASTYGNLGTAYLKVGKYQNAIKSFQESLAISLEKVDRSLEGSSYGHLGNAYGSLGQYKKQIEYYEKSLAICLEIGNIPGEGANYGNLGCVYQKLGQYGRAQDYHRKHLSICLKTGDRSEESFSYSGLGNVYRELGEYEKAMEYYEKSLAIFLEIGERHGEGDCYAGLGNVYVRQGQFEKAKQYYWKNLSICLEIGDKSGEGKAYGQLGNVYYDLGENEKALKYHQQSLAICVKIGDRAGEGTGNGSLGIVYTELGQYEKAIEHCHKSLAIRLEIGIRAGEGRNYHALASVYLSMGQHRKEISYCHKGLAIFLEIGDRPRVATTYASLGHTHLNLGEYDKSIEYNQKALPIILELGEQSTVGRVYGNLGVAYVALRKFETSVLYLKKAIKASDKILMELVVDKSRTSFSDEFYQIHNHLMFSFILLGKIQSAFLAFDLGKAKVLQILIDQRKKSRTYNVAEHSYRNETWNKIDEGEEEERLRDIFKDLQLEESDSTVMVYGFHFTNSFSFFNIWVLSDDGKMHHRIWKPNGDFETAEDWLYNATARLLSQVSVKLHRDCSFFHASSAERVVAGTEGSTGNVTLNVLPRIGRLFDSSVGEPQDNIVTKLFTPLEIPSSDRFDSETLPRSIVTAPRRIVLPNGATLVVTQGRPRLTDQTSKKTATNSSDSNFSDNMDFICRRNSSFLYQALIEPVRDLIKGTKLIIVPDKVLFFAPFCLLLDENDRYLSQSYSIQVTPSLHTLALSMKVPRSNSCGPALFIGNPTVGKVLLCRQPFEVPSLPAATEEARSLALLFNAKPLVEEEATKDRVLGSIDGASIIHIAAHGLEDNGEILLATSSLPKQGEALPTERSYLLAQSDVINRQLSAQLVVLCCCHTGRGEITSEGVLGIARSFLGAGARSVLVALWALPDVTTKIFMEHFYAEICKGISICEALKTTMNMFQQSTNIEHRSFRTWAPFTIIGEDVQFAKEDIEEIRRRSQEAVI